MINLQNSNKDVLAKLMATENITVIHKNTPTAYFDVKNRTLVCPILKDDMSPELYDLFMGHEVGHARYTPEEGWHDKVSEHGGMFKGYLNVIEDVRIEKFIKNKYPGLRRSFFEGYKELEKDDFFGLRKNNRVINELNLIDRINLHYKIGAVARVEFSDEEMVYINRCEKLETFEQVMELALELFEKQKAETEDKIESLTLEELQAMMDDMGIDEDSDDIEQGGESYEIPSDLEDDSENSKGSNSTGEESDDNAEETGDVESTDSDGDAPSRMEEKPDYEGAASAKDKLKDKLNKSGTDEEFRNNEEKLFKADDYGLNEASHYELFDNVKYENYIVDFKTVAKELAAEDFDRTNIKRYVNDFQNNNKKIINYMVKEFEMRKAAADYKRSFGAKSGEINMDKLHLYQLKDDIFNRVQVVPEGKNHGIVMLVDWSGSMSGSVRPTVEQSALLAMFCRRLSIPFKCFAFSDSYGRNGSHDIHEEWSKIRQDYQDKKIDSDEYDRQIQAMHSRRLYGKDRQHSEESINPGNLALLEMFSDGMNNMDFTRALENWFQLSFTIDEGCYYNADYDTRYDGTWYGAAKYHLGGTPLNHSLVVLRDFLKDFKMNQGLDILSLITLTDGQSHSMMSGNPVLIDRPNNKTVNNAGKTASLMNWLKETADVRTIGFYLTKTTGRRFGYEAYSFCGSESYLSDVEDKRKEFNKIATTFEDGYYDLAIMINQKKIDINYDEDQLNVEAGAKKGQLKSALVKAGNNKMRQRVILNQFVKQMAV